MTPTLRPLKNSRHSSVEVRFAAVEIDRVSNNYTHRSGHRYVSSATSVFAAAPWSLDQPARATRVEESLTSRVSASRSAPPEFFRQLMRRFHLSNARRRIAVRSRARLIESERRFRKQQHFPASRSIDLSPRTRGQSRPPCVIRAPQSFRESATAAANIRVKRRRSDSVREAPPYVALDMSASAARSAKSRVWQCATSSRPNSKSRGACPGVHEFRTRLSRHG